MASPTQRWVLLLSMCLLLQQFAPAYTAQFHHHSETYSKQPVREQGQKKGIIWTTLKLVGGRALNTITYGANVLTFTGTMLQAINGCNITEPEIPRLFNQVDGLKTQYDKIRKEIHAISWAASVTQTHANDSFDNYKLTRDLLRRLNDEQVQVLKSWQFFEKVNETDQVVDATEVDTRFGSDLEIALRLSFSGLAVTVPTMKYLWKNHIKQTYVGKKIQQLADRFKTKFTKPVGEAAQRAVKKVLSKGFISRTKDFVSKKLQRLIAFVRPKLERAAAFFDKVKSTMKGVIKLGGAALAVWAAYETFTKCKDKLTDARNSLQQMTSAVRQIKEHKQEMQNAYNLVKEAWQEVWKTTTNDLLMEVLVDVKKMMSDPYFTQSAEERKLVTTLIDNYLGLKDMDPEKNTTQKALSDTQRELNQCMDIVRITLSCYRHKVNMFTVVKRECARGDNAFPLIYKDSIKNLPIDPESKCRYRTGEEYFSKEKMKKGWEEWATNNGTKISTICLMNNPATLDKVKDALRMKKTVPSPEQVFQEAKLNVNEKQEIIEEVRQMIPKIQEMNPNIAKEIKVGRINRYICMKKKRNKTAEEIVEDVTDFWLTEDEFITPEMVENADCSEYM